MPDVELEVVPIAIGIEIEKQKKIDTNYH